MVSVEDTAEEASVSLLRSCAISWMFWSASPLAESCVSSSAVGCGAAMPGQRIRAMHAATICSVCIVFCLVSRLLSAKGAEILADSYGRLLKAHCRLII